MLRKANPQRLGPGALRGALFLHVENDNSCSAGAEEALLHKVDDIQYNMYRLCAPPATPTPTTPPTTTPSRHPPPPTPHTPQKIKISIA